MTAPYSTGAVAAPAARTAGLDSDGATSRPEDVPRAFFLAATLALAVANWSVAIAHAAEDPFDAKNAPTELQRQAAIDEDKITARQLNLFHDLLTTELMPALPDNLVIHYLGLVALDDGRPKWKIHGSIGNPLTWDVQTKNLVLFRLTVTTKRLAASLAKCTLGGQECYINVSAIDQQRTVDDTIPELGMCSIRGMLLKLDGKRNGDDEN